MKVSAWSSDCPGVQIYGTLAALRDEPGIRFITTRHEQATAYMADGYARAGGNFGTALVVPGPGLLNTLGGLSTAYSASSPVLMISGQIPRASIGKNIGLLHEVNDQLDSIAPVTKWRRRVLQVAEIPAAVRAAVEQLKTGRPRPVEIELPPETMEEEGEVELLDPVRHVRPAANAADVDRAAQQLLAAQEPVIYAGGGVHLSGAHEALAAVAEYLQAGVIQSAEGKGAVNDDSDLSLGASIWPRSTLKQYLEKADLVLAVGSRCALAGFRPDQQVIQIDIDPDEIGRNHGKTFGLVGDARATLEALLERLRTVGASRSPRKAEREALRAAIAATDVQEPQASILRALRAGDARRRDPRGRHDPDRLLLASLLARVSAAHLSHLVVLGQPRLCLSGGPRRQGGLSEPAGDLDLRRRGLPLQRAGAGHRRAIRHQRRGRRLQRWRVRQRRA